MIIEITNLIFDQGYLSPRRYFYQLYVTKISLRSSSPAREPLLGQP